MIEKNHLKERAAGSGMGGALRDGVSHRSPGVAMGVFRIGKMGVSAKHF
jgi:hypothetical protein